MLTQILSVVSIIISLFLIKDPVFNAFSRLWTDKKEIKSPLTSKISLSVSIAKEGGIPGYISTPAKIKPENCISICSLDPSGSQIDSINQAKLIKSGDTLVTFKADVLKKQMERAKAAYEKEDNKLKRLQDRIKKGGNVSRSELEDAEKDREINQKEYERLEAEYLRNSKITAGFDGYFGFSEKFGPNSWVRTGEEIAKFVSKEMIVDFSIPQSDIPLIWDHIRPGKQIKAVLQSGSIIDCKVIKVNPALDDKTFCLPVRAKPVALNQAQEDEFKSNFHISVKIPVQRAYSQEDRVFRIKSSALCLYNDNDISRKDERIYILVLDDNDRVRKAFVSLGSREKDEIEVQFTDKFVIDPIINAGKSLRYLTYGDINAEGRQITPLYYGIDEAKKGGA